MSDTSAFIASALQRLPDLQPLEAYLEQDIEALVDQILPPVFPQGDGLESFHPQTGPSQPKQQGASKPEREQLSTLLLAGKQALQKIRKDHVDAALDTDEMEGLESVILAVGRPALHIKDGSFFCAPPNWGILEQNRLAIEQTCRSVGRIEIRMEGENGYVGTGFLVAENVIMTNKHVADFFCQEVSHRWIFRPTVVSSIDYLKELDCYQAFEFEVIDIIGIHEHFDLALLKTASLSFQGQAANLLPLVLASNPSHVSPEYPIYTVGHPMWDGNQDDPGTIDRIFGGPHGVKRLQPGLVRGIFPGDEMFTHDCSTLTGNSGSCVVDLHTHKVLGLHIRGMPRQVNRAVALWRLSSDPLMKQAGVWFE